MVGLPSIDDEQCAVGKTRVQIFLGYFVHRHRRWQHSGVVESAVHTAERFDAGSDQSVDLRRLRNIAGAKEGTSTGRFDVAHGLRRAQIDVADGHGGTFAREGESGGAPCRLKLLLPIIRWTVRGDAFTTARKAGPGPSKRRYFVKLPQVILFENLRHFSAVPGSKQAHSILQNGSIAMPPRDSEDWGVPDGPDDEAAE